MHPLAWVGIAVAIYAFIGMIFAGIAAGLDEIDSEDADEVAPVVLFWPVLGTIALAENLTRTMRERRKKKIDK
tara:strand:- start:21832 stop:22050 length:219 start_codon:yes stop_codon:yes gene_type:complete